MKKGLPFLFIFLTSLAFSQTKTVTYVKDPNAYPPVLVIDLKHVNASLEFIPEKQLVIGEAILSVIPFVDRPDSITFQAPDFEVRSVEMEGKTQRFKMQGKNLVIYPVVSLYRGNQYRIKIIYQACPHATGIYFVGWKPGEEGKRKQIWAHRPFGWLPYVDARVTMDLTITFDGFFSVFTNGERISVKDNQDGTKSWYFRMAKDHPYFSTALAIGDYTYQTSQTSHGIPLEFLYYPGMEDRVEPTYKYTEEMFDFFEDEIGSPYPYPVYREIPVSDYMYGGMETTTSTIFGDYMLIDPRAYWQRNYINVNAHELAHQWFGDCIGHLAHKDVWLTESFATYYAKLFERSVFGDDYYQNSKKQELDAALFAATRNDYPVGGSQGGIERIYQKGSLVLGMLRYVMGDQVFKNVISTYFTRFQFRYAETSDFFRVVYDVTGDPYQWFFDEWILRGGEPHYQVSYSSLEDTTGNIFTKVVVDQIHETNDLIGLFKMPVTIEIHYQNGEVSSEQRWIEKETTEIWIPNRRDREIAFVLFDPGREIVKKVTFKKDVNDWISQAVRAGNMIDRYDALVALRDYPLDKKRELLIACYRKEKFHLTKSEILDQLTSDDTPESIELFREAVKDRDAEVRKTAILVKNPVPFILQDDYEELLQDSSYLNVALVLDRLCSDFPESCPYYLTVTENETGWRGKNIRIKWLEIALSRGNKELLPELIGYSAPSQDFETRINALNTLKKLNYLDSITAANTVLASVHWNRKLQGTGQAVLLYFFHQAEYRELISQIASSIELTPDETIRLAKMLVD